MFASQENADTDSRACLRTMWGKRQYTWIGGVGGNSLLSRYSRTEAFVKYSDGCLRAGVFAKMHIM